MLISPRKQCKNREVQNRKIGHKIRGQIRRPTNNIQMTGIPKGTEKIKITNNSRKPPKLRL